jgi:putative SOS response-associated peptidase YedK
MCGRYTLRTPDDSLVERFKIDEYPSSILPSYNIAPTQEVAAVVEEDEERKLELLRWGLIPSWAKDPEIGSRMINARGETVSETPSFRKAFKARRCLILADGFYEWQKIDNGKQPYHVRMKDASPFAFAGLWEIWNGDEDGIRTCAIITTEPNDLMSEIHHRMPVILHPDDYEMWLDPSFEEKGPLSALLKPYPDYAMETYPVSRRVNRPTNDEPGCVEPAA